VVSIRRNIIRGEEEIGTVASRGKKEETI